MRFAFRFLLSGWFLIAAAPAASAQVQLAIHDGRVTLLATDATVRQILSEWARVGQTRVVNVERIPGGPLTLQLTDVPEAEALDLLLRSVTGYMAVKRPADEPNLSRFDRILVLPTAAVARVPVTTAPAPVFQQPFQQRPVENDDNEGPSIPPPRGPLFQTLPSPQPGPFQTAPSQQPGVPQVIDDQQGNPPQGGGESPNGQQPFGQFPGASSVGTPRPGMVTPSPAPPGPGGPAQPVPTQD
jgi:hypothetical protein